MSKRKKHNPIKRYETQAAAAVSGVALAMVLSVDNKHVNGYKLSTGDKIAITPSVARAVSDCRFKWAILLVVWSEESNGKMRTVTQYERMAAMYQHTALIDHLNAEHQAMIASERERGNEPIDAGWVAAPVPKLDDEELQIKMMGVIENVRSG